MFVGIIVISIGLGAAIPSLERIAAPVVCSNGKLMLESETYNPVPGETTITRTWLCVDKASGKEEKVTFYVAWVAGVIDGLILFVLSVIALIVNKKFGKSAVSPAYTATFPQRAPVPPQQSNSFQELGRLEKLKELYDANLITDEEYEKKKRRSSEGTLTLPPLLQTGIHFRKEKPGFPSRLPGFSFWSSLQIFAVRYFRPGIPYFANSPM